MSAISSLGKEDIHPNGQLLVQYISLRRGYSSLPHGAISEPRKKHGNRQFLYVHSACKEAFRETKITGRNNEEDSVRNPRRSEETSC